MYTCSSFCGFGSFGFSSPRLSVHLRQAQAEVQSAEAALRAAYSKCRLFAAPPPKDEIGRENSPWGFRFWVVQRSGPLTFELSGT